LIIDDRTISYEELDSSTTRLARQLLRQGCQPGDRIAIHWSNSIEVVKLFFACFKAAMIAVPVNVRMKTPEIAYVLQHSQAVMLFSQPELAPAAEAACRDSRWLRGSHTSLKDLDTGEARNVMLPHVNCDVPAVIMYTSGTTARPKGATHTHRTLLRTAKMIEADSNQRMLAMTQLVHASGLLLTLLSILSDATLILAPRFDASLVLDLIESYKCTYAFALPSFVQSLLDEQTRRPRDVGSMKTFFAGGDTVPVSVQERFHRLFKIHLREVYGMTESALTIVNPPDDIRRGSLGRPIRCRAGAPGGCER
jgi:long-chain acyl-CoA synthetase